MKRPRFVIYPAKDGYRWRLLAANNRIIADSAEAYSRRSDAERATETTMDAAISVSLGLTLAAVKNHRNNHEVRM